jgi:hypothetical protein
MDFVLSLESIFKPVRQCVIATNDDKLVFANPAALDAFGDDLLQKRTDEIFPAELLGNTASSFMCASSICGRPAKTFVSRSDEIKLHYIDLVPEPGAGGAMVITRRMMSYLRNCISGIKIAADRCFSKTDMFLSPDPKIVSILYHYYYRLLRTIVQIDYADKLERHEMVFSPAPCDLAALGAKLADTLLSVAGELNANIRFSTENGRLMAFVDSALIEFMLLNIFSNSLKSTRPGTTIDFAVNEANNKIVISLDDNGCGIPQDRLSEIFTLASDEHDSRHPDEGIGLGLYISQEIVRLHDGVMLVESRENEGVHIRILLPAARESPSLFNAPETRYRASGMSSVLTVLADSLTSECYGPRFED